MSDEHESSEGDCDTKTLTTCSPAVLCQMSMNPRKGTVTLCRPVFRGKVEVSDEHESSEGDCDPLVFFFIIEEIIVVR